MFPLSELGSRLKEERERKNISIEDLQRETKIQKRYLLAIEEGRFDVLPGKFYARAFIKNYAEAVGLDPDQLFAEYSHELPNPAKEISDLPPRSERYKQPMDRKSKRKSTFIHTLIGFVVILLLIVGIYVVVQALVNDNPEEIAQEEEEKDFDGDFSEELPLDEEEVAKETEQEKEGEAVVEETEKEEVEEAKEETQTIKFVQTVGNNSIYELTGTDKFIAAVEFTGTCYLDIKNAKGHAFEPGTNKEAGTKEEYDFSEEEEIVFNFGASQFAKLVINGEHVPFPLKPEDHAVQRITIKFIKKES